MELLERFFASITHQESITFLLFLLGAFLIGFLLAWAIWGSVAARRRTALQQAEAELQAVQAEYTDFKEQYALKEADLQKASIEVEEYRRQLQSLEEEKRSLSLRLRRLQEAVDQKDASLQAYSNTIDDLNNQILGLKTKNQQLSREPVVVAAGTPRESAVDAGQMADLQTTLDDTMKRLSQLEERMTVIDAENDELKSELGALKVAKPVSAIPEAVPSSTPEIDPVLDLSIDPNIHPPLNEVDQAQQIVEEAIGNRIPRATAADKDDLKLIDGIGPFIEKKLNQIGLYTYEQIASLDDSLVDFVTTAIEFFPGRIERDDWVGQAARLAAIKEKDPNALKKKDKSEHQPDDLKIVEGIGPKIEEVLKNAGISDLETLAQTESEQIAQILTDAGDRFRMHDPTTWPQQAQLAANGQWEMLKEYQDFLIGGRNLNKK
ncbi:MAG: hypothetical protein KDC44_01410 [Phaeodactylibacter sp.]|nr:hypothetical protein [Phaeodactylibacter sp.]